MVMLRNQLILRKFFSGEESDQAIPRRTSTPVDDDAEDDSEDDDYDPAGTAESDATSEGSVTCLYYSVCIIA